jgi:putative hydrolase of the HAD superfamily
MKNVKRIAAIIGIVLIASMYLISLISAFVATEYTNGLFLASIFSTIVIPIMIYGFIAIYKYVHRNDNLNNEE